MKTPTTTVTMKRPKLLITVPRFSTLKILLIMTLATPKGDSHITPVTILRITVSITEKKSTTTAPFLPREPSRVPKTRQKTMMPRVLVPALYLTDRTISVILASTPVILLC